MTTDQSQQTPFPPQDDGATGTTGDDTQATGDGSQAGDDTAAPLLPEEEVFHWEGAFHSFSTSIVLGEHPSTSFDEELFLFFLKYSLAISPEEKIDIIERIGELTQSQIDQLLSIFADEQVQFSQLERQHPDYIRKERSDRLGKWETVVEAHFARQAAAANDNAEAEEIKRQLGL